MQQDIKAEFSQNIYNYKYINVLLIYIVRHLNMASCQIMETHFNILDTTTAFYEVLN